MDTETPLALLFASQLATQTVGYFAITSLAFLLVWKWGAKRFAHRRVQKQRLFTRGQLRHEVKHSLVTLLLGTGNGIAVLLLQQAGYTKLSMNMQGWTGAPLVMAVVGLIAFNDLWFYAVHRLLHHKRLFRYVHAVHHRSVDTNPFTSYSFHAIEALLLGGWIFPLVILVPMPVAALGVAMVIGSANNLMAHLGYEFLPPWILRVPGLRWMNSATFHGMHHARSHGNYGLFTRVWDRLFGTEIPGYTKQFLRGQRENNSTESST